MPYFFKQWSILQKNMIQQTCDKHCIPHEQFDMYLYYFCLEGKFTHVRQPDEEIRGTGDEMIEILNVYIK